MQITLKFCAANYQNQLQVEHYITIIRGFNIFIFQIKLFILECDKWKSNLKNSKDINSVVQNLKLDSKTADEEKIDDCLLHDMLFKQKQYGML